MLNYIKGLVVGLYEKSKSYAAGLYQAAKAFIATYFWYILGAALIVGLIAGIALGGEIVNQPVVKGQPFATIVLGQCPDKSKASFSDYDIDGDDETDVRVLLRNDREVGYLVFDKGDNEPKGFVLLRTDGRWEKMTRDEVGQMTICDLPSRPKLKEARNDCYRCRKEAPG